uniref:Uncharacterized protein n=1 Tax=Poecilia mexicana TaxID=48701 RepID=A0A3B3XPC0_9TELE
MAVNIIPAPSCFKADVWAYFGFKKKKDSDFMDKTLAVCKLCHTSVKNSGNTTNLRAHLKRHHPDKVMLAEELHRDPKQTRLDSDGMFSHKLPTTSPRSQKITETIVYFICQDLRPYTVVENAGFRLMVNAMEPRYQIPTREHLTKVCVPRLYAQTKAHVKASIDSAERVALMCDGWTSRTTEAYVTITAHFINEEWELVNYVLQTTDMPESHTRQNLAEHLRKALTEWGITEKDPVIVTDNASNMSIAAAEAAFSLHVKCYAHTLNLAAQRALKVTAVARLLGRVRRIVSFFRRSTTGSHILKEKQMLLRLPQHKLMTGAHDMLERFLEQQPAICAALLSNVTTAEDVVSALKPMKEATQYMSKEKIPSPSVIAPLQDKLLNGLKPIEGESSVMKDMKAAIATLYASSAMDPRFKSLPFLTDNKRQEVYNGLVAEAARLSIQPLEHDPRHTQEDEAKEQMTRYREADLLEVKEDPLVWWKEHQYEYPLLSHLAKRYLCIPGTSVSSVFSTAGDIITAQRSALLPEHVDQILFLNKNLRRMWLTWSAE